MVFVRGFALNVPLWILQDGIARRQTLLEQAAERQVKNACRPAFMEKCKRRPFGREPLLSALRIFAGGKASLGLARCNRLFLSNDPFFPQLSNGPVF